MEKQRVGPKKLTSYQIILLAFAGIILTGALLLMLPFSSKNGAASFSDALFTSTSAICVTGLVVRDTASSWSGFGQALILLMIQIGGLGIVSIAASFAMLSGRKFSLLQRSTMQSAISAPQMGDIVKMTRFIVVMSLIIELAGAILLMPVLIPAYGMSGIWMSFFHAISAFCNAGFDIMGTRTGAFTSLTSFAGNIWVIVVIMLLIIIGGIGFFTWDDIFTKGIHFGRYRMQSKVILVTSGLLILIPAVVFFFGDFADMPVKERICLSIFQAVTPRTAGFNTADLTAMTTGGRAIIIVLMLIGGSPGSTAGGMKTTTAAVLVANVVAVIRKRKSVEFFGRRIEDGVVKSAGALLILYLFIAVIGALVISALEGMPVSVCLFEAASAVGTVGLTLGITSSLHLVSRLILIFMMFFGRVGGLTIIFALTSRRNHDLSQNPVEGITVG